MLITMSATRNKTNIIEAAARGGRRLVLSSQPFVPRSGGKNSNPVTGKWAPRNSVERPTRHNLPVDILLAGAPNEVS